MSVVLTIPVRVGYISSIVFPDNLTGRKIVTIIGEGRKKCIVVDERSGIEKRALQEIEKSISKISSLLYSNQAVRTRIRDGCFGGFQSLLEVDSPEDLLSSCICPDLKMLVNRIIAVYSENERAWS